MGMFKEIGGGTINYGLGKFVPQLIGFFLIPLYTAYLNPEDYGLVELAGSFAAFAMIFMRLALPGSVQRFYYEHKEGKPLRDYITTIFWALIVISIVSGIIIYIIAYFFIESLVPGLPIYPFVLVILLTSIFNTNSEIQKRLIQARKMSRYSAILSLITALVGIFFAILFVVVFKQGAFGIILSGLITGILFFIQAQFYLRKDMGGSFSLKLLQPSLKYALYILPSHLVSPIGNLFSRSILSGVESLAAVGLYSLAYRFVNPLTMLTTAFNTSYIPIYFEVREKNEPQGYEKLKAACKKIWLISILIYVFVAVFFPPIILLITPEKYHQAAPLIPFMAFNFLLGVLTVIYGPEMYYSKKTWWISVMAVVRFVSYLAISYFFTKFLGMYAIVLALFAENIICLFFSVLISRKMFDFNPGLKSIIFTGLIGTILVALNFAFVQSHFTSTIQIFSAFSTVFIFIGILFLIKELEIKTLKNFIKFK